jgi:restriction system protein
MTIPGYESLMLPVLKLAADGSEHRIRDVIRELAEQEGVTEEEQRQRLPCGNRVFANRVHWARHHLIRAELLRSTKHAFFQITERGEKAIKESSSKKIDFRYLKQSPEFAQSRKDGKGDEVEACSATELKFDENPTVTPDEQIQSMGTELKKALINDLREKILKEDDKFFEQLVVHLLKKIFPNTSASVTGKKGDRGIDGVIVQDPFGLERIYCQAKRFEKGPVGRKDVSGFCNDIGTGIGTKGFFVTLSCFTAEARECAAKHTHQNVSLIDGNQLLSLLIDHNIGVKEAYTIHIKRIDAEYFAEAE